MVKREDPRQGDLLAGPLPPPPPLALALPVDPASVTGSRYRPGVAGVFTVPATARQVVVAGRDDYRRNPLGGVSYSTVHCEDGTWFASFGISTPLPKDAAGQSPGIGLYGPAWYGAASREDAERGAWLVLLAEVEAWPPGRWTRAELSPGQRDMLQQAAMRLRRRLAGGGA